jgi:phage tail sheath protein FI
VALNLADIAFEPNDFSLWIRIERELSGYLESLTRQGALVGSHPEEAFFVKCDAETNPPDVRDRGQVMTRIGLAPSIPGEFIEVQLLHGETGVVLTTTP